MSTDLFLNQDKVNELEPFEGDERTRAMLSPYAVPRTVSLDLDDDLVEHVEFGYSEEETEGGAAALDARSDPKVIVATGNETQKVLSLDFTPAVGVDGLRRVAKRLEEQALGIQSKAKKLSYVMTARVLTEFVIAIALSRGDR